jgi:hypothetical protein
VRQVHVLTTGTREIDAQFGVRDRTGQGEQSPGRPAEQDQSRATQISRHEAGGRENSGTDHVGDDEGSGAEEPDLPQQSGSRDWREA